jgi:competence protein ComEC
MMATGETSPPQSVPPFGAGRQPAVLVATALALGVVSDSFLSSIGPMMWLSAAGCLLIVSLVLLCLRVSRAASVQLVIAFFALGAARHRLFEAVPENDIRHFARVSPRLVRLVGVVDEPPWIRRAPQGPMQATWAQIDHSVCVLDCRTILADDGPVDVTGRVRLDVDGHLLHIETSDIVQVTGWLSLPAPPSNPGEDDYSVSLHRRGLSAMLSSDHPDAVQKKGTSEGILPLIRKTIARLRNDGDALFARRLSKSNAPVASALLLGDRSGLTDELREAFAQSGMMHVLAISGLNVGILALLVWPLCRLCHASPATTAIVLCGVGIGYAALADGSPPVVRATVLLVVMALALPWNRAVSTVNALGVAALVVLLWRPTDLFDVGAQLSFLSVAGMIWIGRFRRLNAGVRGPDMPRTFVGELLANAFDFVRESCLLMGAVWLFTLPLVLARFHLLSISGLVLNVVLIPFVTVVMWLGYLTLFVGLLVPPAAVLFAVPFDWGLSVFLWAVESAASLTLGHIDVPPPAAWWLAGHYFLLTVLFFAGRKRLSQRIVMAVAAWAVVGLGIGLGAPTTSGLRCMFLAVGHGGAVLLELPDGRTLLYDAGSIQNPRRAERAIETALWNRGHHRIDGVIVSHADIDHYNAVPGLLERIPVGTVFAGRSFLDFSQEPVRECCESAFRQGVPIRLIAEGDRLAVGDDVAIRILHPPDPWDSGSRANDNAHSLVVLVEYAGRRILLTGDLEKEGLKRLLQREKLDVDVLQTPHHGSIAANPRALRTWSTPEVAVASSGRNVLSEELRNVYGTATRVITTFEEGATTIEVGANGAMRVNTAR